MYLYQNIHRHSYRTNIRVPDSVTSNEAYAKRAVELGHGIISSCEHGWQGRYIECFELAEQYHLKFVEAAEAYWVKNRFEKDRTNCHIVLAAKNENGRRALNKALSIANQDGFYGQARLDIPLILSLPADDVIVQTACVAYWRYDDVDDITQKFAEHFKHFYLEVQPHNTEFQRKVNDHILELANRYQIPIILGTDSHYIKPDDALERADYTASKGMSYPEEDGMILDYPDGDTVYARFAAQSILGHREILTAMDNTNIYLEVEDYDCPCFNHDIKMPTLYPGWTQEEKNAEYDKQIWSAWEKEKANIDAVQWDHYESEIQKEIDIVHTTLHADYFLIDQRVIAEGKCRGGVITSTGRGSGPSFYTNKLLGLTEIDRIGAKVTMYPERFMSPTRILETHSLADIDLNVADRAPFLEAQKAVLGDDHSWPMIAYGTLKTKAAWKMYAKSQNVPFEIANEISDQIGKYEEAVKHADEDEEIDVYDYIDEAYKDTFDGCQSYLGITSHVTPHPCATLVYQGSISEEIGLISVKGEICTVMDGLWAEQYKFLKNDWLRVAVVDLIDRVYKRIGIPRHTVTEILALCPPDSPVWNVYKHSCTMGINQVEQPGTSHRVAIYSPKNITELCAFVAAVRPGFKSMYKTFESREHFEYGIPKLDAILQTEEMPNSFILYQELSMAVINYAGIPMSECYDIIKNIAKKRVEKVLKYKEQFIEGFKKSLMTDGEDDQTSEMVANEVWQILEDSSAYSFNCVEENTKLFRSTGKNSFHPTVGEMYSIANDGKIASDSGHKDLHSKYKTYGYGKTLSMFADGRVRENEIVDIVPSGKRTVYEIVTKTGRKVLCTSNHKIPTPNGERELRYLRAGSQVYLLGDYEKTPNKRYNFGTLESNLPKPGQRGFQKRPGGAYAAFKIMKETHEENEDSCEICGVTYSKDQHFELHHKDHNRSNPSPDNLVWLCNSCHKKEHYKTGRIGRYEKGIPTILDEIESITYIGVRDTYNIEMADPAHNFVLDNGLIVSNCSHSYSVAIDSLYGAFLKETYPCQFYETFLRILEEKGEKDRLNATKEEAEDYYRIKFLPYRFGQDNRDITADPEKNEITKSIASIKGYSRAVGDLLWECAQEQHENFISVLRWLDGHSIKDAKVRPLIKIGYFQEFGNSVELCRILDIWNFFGQGTAKKIACEKLAGKPLEGLVREFATNINKKGIVLKTWTITDIDGLLSECEKYILDQGIPEVDYKVMAQNQKDVLDYVDLVTNKKEDRRKVMVLDVFPLNDKRTGKPWGYRVGTKSIGTGKTAKLTVRAKTYENRPFKDGAILFCTKCSQNKTGYWYLENYEYVI